MSECVGTTSAHDGRDVRPMLLFRAGHTDGVWHPICAGCRRVLVDLLQIDLREEQRRYPRRAAAA